MDGAHEDAWGRALLVIGLLLGGILALTIFGYQVYFVRPNPNPNRSLTSRQFFHQKLAAILSVDHQIDAAEAAIAAFEMAHHRPWGTIAEQEYNHDEQRLYSLQRLRRADIADYNAASTNPETGRDRDLCLPATLDPHEPLPIEEQRLALLHC